MTGEQFPATRPPAINLLLEDNLSVLSLADHLITNPTDLKQNEAQSARAESTHKGG